MLIRNKLILQFTGLALLIQVGLSGFVYWFSGVVREQRFTDRLAGEAALAARLLVRDHNLDRSYLRRFHPREVPNLVGEELSLFDAASGELLYANTDSGSGVARTDHRRYYEHFRQSPVLQDGPPRFVQGTHETIALLYHHLPTGHHYVLLAGGYDEDGRQQLRRLRRGLLVGNVGALAVIVLAGWFFADEALRPIARIVQRVRRITAEHLDERLDEGNGTDEIAQLAGTFNRMLAGLEDTFERQRDFVAHASHELRTPLAVMRGTLETALTYDQTLPEARASMAQAMNEIEKLIALTNGLLIIARTNATNTLRHATTVRLDECLLEALAETNRRYPGLSVSLQLGETPASHPPDAEPYAVHGYAALLETALVNLLDNAGKYGAAPVTVTLHYPDAATLQVLIRDHGPGLAPAELARVFEPLFRGEQTRHQPGFGLGLVVVQRVAQIHGGTVALTAAEGAGTTAVLTLPAR